MKVARMLFPVNNLGPGNRVAIWMAGCPRSCKGCANPELQDCGGVKDIDINILRSAVEQFVRSADCSVDGFTITGGEPFMQPEALVQIIRMCHEYTDDILVFSGYKREELKEYEDLIISNISVLIDGPYIESQNNSHPLKGSDNQVIHYIDEKQIDKYQNYYDMMQGKNYVECFRAKDGMIVTGIHRSDFREEYNRHINMITGKERDNE